MKQEQDGKTKNKNNKKGEKELSTNKGKMKNTKKNYQQRNKRGKVKKQSELAHGFTYNI